MRSRSTQATVGALAPLGVGVLAGAAAWRLELGSLGEPGAGLWPLIVSLAMVTLSLVLLLGPDDGAEQEPVTRQAMVVVWGVVSLVAYALLFERVGFEIPTMLLLVLWLRVFGRDSWRLTLTVAVGATAALYLIFIVFLGVSVPHIVVL